MISKLRGKPTILRFCCCVTFLAVMGVSCSGGNIAESDALYHLDQNKTSIVQRIESKDRLDEGCKFVQVEVVKVVNPKRYALTFKVRYRSSEGNETPLGSFSLYPADNPGKFIVPAQGKVRNQGAIVLSMVIEDKMDPKDTIEVAVKRITFLKEELHIAVGDDRGHLSTPECHCCFG